MSNNKDVSCGEKVSLNSIIHRIMTVWDAYPKDYRLKEIEAIFQAVTAGDSVAVIGLSGSGKSNLLGYIANRFNVSCENDANTTIPGEVGFVFVDCNRLIEPTPDGFFKLVGSVLVDDEGRDSVDVVGVKNEYSRLEKIVDQQISDQHKLCFLIDRFDALYQLENFSSLANSLRSLRDKHKYQLTYIIASRRPIDSLSELAELFYGNTIWLGPLSNSNAHWSARRDSSRLSGYGDSWDDKVIDSLVKVSWGYPSLLRACCQAYAETGLTDLNSICEHHSVERRVAEFWADQPDEESLRKSNLLGQPILENGRLATMKRLAIDFSNLTAKEDLLLKYFLDHSGKVCIKDDLIAAVWPEDRIFEQGIRDDSLAQLIRRLRVKIEPDPSDPELIQTVPGRGYIFKG